MAGAIPYFTFYCGHILCNMISIQKEQNIPILFVGILTFANKTYYTTFSENKVNCPIVLESFSESLLAQRNKKGPSLQGHNYFQNI